MGSGSSQLLRSQSTSSPAFSDKLAIEAPPQVLCEEMATRRPAETGEHSVSAASCLTPEKVSRLKNSFQDVQEFVSLVPSILEHQSVLEAKIANYQRSRQAVSEDRAYVSESNAENISSSTRPSLLEMKYQDFYDHDRVDAIDSIEKSRLTSCQCNQIEDSRIACIVFGEAYKAALDFKENFIECMSLILTAAPSIGASHHSQKMNRDLKDRDFSISLKTDGCKTSSLGQSVVKHLKVIMKETSDICNVGALVQRIEEALNNGMKQGRFKDYDHRLFSKPEMKKYIVECCEYAWKLVCQTPPYVLETHSDRVFDSTRHQICRDIKHPGGNSSSGQLVRCVIWPGLFVGLPPRVIRKTEVI